MQTLFPDEVVSAPSVPHSGPARADLQKRFARRLQVNPQLSRKLVSYQGNKGAVGFRWLKYKEGFSTALVRQFIERGQGTQVLDPFSGAGTTALTAMSMGIPATGIEILPLGTLAAQTVAYAANGLPLAAFRTAAHALLNAIAEGDDDGQYALTHVPITQGAFPGSTDHEIARARKFIAALTDPALAAELSNRNVITLLENYFTEMAVIVHELARVVRAGGRVFMVNDNVRYHGEEVPVDLILSDFAEQCGFHCAAIWMLKRGKGNSSQQMGRFGRREIRKCVYEWVKVDIRRSKNRPHDLRV